MLETTTMTTTPIAQTRRRHREPMTLDEMRALTGPPLRVSDLAAITGFSSKKIANDIHSGDLKANRSNRSGEAFVFVIAFAEAKRYLTELGYLDS